MAKFDIIVSKKENTLRKKYKYTTIYLLLIYSVDIV